MEQQKKFAALREPDAQRDILSLLSLASKTNCSNERDKVYSLYSVLPVSERNLITFDYGRPEFLVFAETTHITIRVSNTLDCLAFVRCGSQRELSLPSWVIDFKLPAVDFIDFISGGVFHGSDHWLQKKFTNLINKRVSKEDFRPKILANMREDLSQLGAAAKPWCSARPHTQADTTFDAERGTLRFKGLEFDEIVSVMALKTVKPFHFHTKSNTVRDLCNTMATNFATSGNPYDLLRAHQQVSFTDRMHKIAEDGGLGLQSIDPLFDTWHQAAGRSADDDELGEVWVDYCSFAGQIPALFLTKSGFFGYAPWDAQLHDRIVLPYGGRFPVVLRPSEGAGTWIFQGLVTIPGIMQDELIKRDVSVELKELDFVLT